MAEEATVFVVDDDAAVRDSMRLLLESVSLHVLTFADASEFLNSYKSHRPGCLVLDARLPDIDGLELQQLLRAQRLVIPVIMVTGHGDVSMAVRAMKAGALVFWRSPITASSCSIASAKPCVVMPRCADWKPKSMPPAAGLRC